MTESNQQDINNFLYPHSRYRGQFTSQNLVFDANLQEFAQRVTYICSLETNGKLSSEEAYQEIKRIWHQLKESRKELGIGSEPPLEQS